VEVMFDITYLSDVLAAGESADVAAKVFLVLLSASFSAHSNSPKKALLT
jgi:hypothetical protein